MFDREALKQIENNALIITELYKVIFGQIDKNSLILIHATPGTGKTTFALELLNNLVTHNNYNHKVFSYEEAPALLAKHIARIKAEQLLWFEFEDYNFPTNESLILLDSVDEWAQKQNTKNYPDIEIANKLYELKKNHACIIAIQHTNKLGKPTGSAAFSRVSDINIYLKRTKEGYIQAEITKNRFSSTTTTKLEMTKSGIILLKSPWQKLAELATTTYQKWSR